MNGKVKRRMIRRPITFDEWEKGLAQLKPKHQAYAVLIYYTGIRVSEALRLTKESFTFDNDHLYVDVGIRLKTKRKLPNGSISSGRKTQPIPISLQQPHIDMLVKKIKHTRKAERVFKFNRTTANRAIAKAELGYNHLYRLTAITEFLKAGKSIAEIVNWFGISVQTVNNYIGLVGLKDMGDMKR